MIPRNVKLAEAPSHGKPALWYDKYCQGATAHLALANELLNQIITEQLKHEMIT